ncbi:DUF2946 family protein [Marilutibacter aestuarii]|uniref:DUF2946 domain-containing protein n=1 Tax=Marilutibacter aestuarii TaxID=1706195 RepID=A0A508AP44_9GAMM|nr:DUF2946 family protein [Lysobacter aestuarii]TQD48915.1 DUF2946 domain-containing protein [Lysobacter aestuarii]
MRVASNIAAVIRSRSFQSGMLRLAFVATLLLVLLPTFGRLAESRVQTDGSNGADAHWTAICTVAGIQYIALPDALAAPGHAGAGAHSGKGTPAHPGADCDYCPLLASLLVVALCWAILGPQGQRAIPTVPAPSARRWQRHPCGLGSRGPPIAL